MGTTDLRAEICSTTSALPAGPSITSSAQPTPFMFNYQPSNTNLHALPSTHIPDKSRKRKNTSANREFSAEQNEIKYLKIELNSVRTNLLEVETERNELNNKVKIMEDLVKSYEEREVSPAYRDNYRAPHHASDPRFPACACLQSSSKYHRCTCYSSCPHLSQSHVCPTVNHPTPSSCSSSPGSLCSACSSPSNLSLRSEITSLNEIVTTMKNVLDKLQCEMVDVVNNIESVNQVMRNQSENPPENPVHQYPIDLPDYDNIEVLEIAQVHVSAETESISSIDDLVPDQMKTSDCNTD